MTTEFQVAHRARRQERRRRHGASFPWILALFAYLVTSSGHAAFGLGDLFEGQKVAFLKPARSTAAAELRTLVLLPVNANGVALASALESILTNLRVDGRPYYNQVVSNGPPRSASTNLSLPAISAISRSANAAGVVVLDVSAAPIRQETYTASRSRCNSSSNSFKCPKKSTQNYTVNCQRRSASAVVSLRVFDVRTSAVKLVTSNQVPGSGYSSACSGDAQTIADDRDITNAALNAALQGVAQILAPTSEQHKLELMTPDKAIPATSRNVFEGAIKFARAGRMDEACDRFDTLYADNKNSIALTYNMGFCEESRGEYLKAQSEYQAASTLVNAPNSLIDGHLNDVRHSLSEGAVTPTALGLQFAGSPALAQGRIPTAAELRGEKRVALVIGNSRYEHNALLAPVNDARAMRTALIHLGFDVTEVENATGGQFMTAINDFVERASSADVALLYYSGHGAQINGGNWLLPVDNGEIQEVTDVVANPRQGGEPWGIQLSSVLSRLDRPSRVSIVILDACRNNPFPASVNRSKSMGSGLAAVREVPKGSLVAFATTEGQTAATGGGTESIYTRHLSKLIETPDITIEELFKRVREGVETETSTQGHAPQVPTEVAALTGDFYFRVSQ